MDALPSYGGRLSLLLADLCSSCRSAPPDMEGEPMGFIFKLELEDGAPADPPRLETAVPTWRIGDTIPLGRDRILRVIDTQPGQEPDEQPVLVVRG